MSEQPLMPGYAGAHADPFPPRPDAAPALRERRLPRHRARRPVWKPDLQPVHAQHLQNSEALVG